MRSARAALSQSRKGPIKVIEFLQYKSRRYNLIFWNSLCFASRKITPHVNLCTARLIVARKVLMVPRAP